MYNDTNNVQQAKAKRIIREALRRGLLVSVSDGDGDWLCTRSSDERQIIDAIGEMDMDELIFRTADGAHAGWMMLVWEHGGSADELPADYTDNDMMNALARA